MEGALPGCMGFSFELMGVFAIGIN
jgi:hypothetical protein